jgi:hypothetical protein
MQPAPGEPAPGRLGKSASWRPGHRANGRWTAGVSILQFSLNRPPCPPPEGSRIAFWRAVCITWSAWGA